MAEGSSLTRDAKSARERLDKERLTPREAAALHARIEATFAGNRQGMRIALLVSGPIAVVALTLIIVLRPAARHDTHGCMREHAGFIDIDPACSEPVAIGRGSDVITAQAGAHLEESSRGVRVRSGEVAFSVHKRAQGESMRVLVSHGDIEITGTHFTVKQRHDGGEVHLDEGSILFHWADGEEQRVAPGETLAWPRRAANGPVTLQPIALQPEVTLPPAAKPPPTPVAKAQPPKAPPPKPPKPPAAKPPAAEPEPETQAPETPAAGPMTMEEVLKQMALLRSQHRYSDAVDLLRAQVARQDFSDVQRARLSFEMGMIMQDRLDDAAAACAHWRAHLRKFPDDAVHADRVQEYVQKCEQP